MEQILKYFPNLTALQIEKYSKLIEIFPELNSKVNLISRKDIDNLVVHHILHSLFIAKVFDFSPNSQIVDIGTGGGFPGIPLALMYPEVKFDLVDSIEKKIKIVSEIKDILQLPNVFAITKRAELLAPKYDFVVSRAVSAFPEFVKISKNLFRKNPKIENQGILYLKGGDFDNEIQNFKNIKIFNISDYFEEEYFKTKKLIFMQKKY